MNIGDRIRKLRKAAGLSQKQVADGVGVDRAAVSQWETGKNEIYKRNLIELAKLFNTTEQFILYGKEEDESKAITQNKQKRRVPIYRWDRAKELIGMDDGEKCDFVAVLGDIGDRAYALQIRGDSMSPEFNQGEMIIVDPDVTEQNGSFVVAIVGESPEAILRQMVREGEDTFLRPVNREYQLIDCQIKKVEIIGVVVQKTKIYE